MEDEYSNLGNILAEPDLVLVFREFLKNSYSSENLAFIVEIENYKDMWNQGAEQNVIVARAQQIYEKYFSTESKYELNVAGNLLEELKDKMRNPTTTIFNKVQHSIFKLVEIDSFPRFAKSEEYRKAVEELKRKKNKGSGIFKKKDSHPELIKRLSKRSTRERSDTINLLEDFFKNRPSQEQIVANYSTLSGSH